MAYARSSPHDSRLALRQNFKSAAVDTFADGMADNINRFTRLPRKARIICLLQAPIATNIDIAAATC